jgi:hypothetical protein
MSETYCYITWCSNCGERQHFDVPKGIRKATFIDGKKCKRCGCLIQPKKAWEGAE